MRESIWFWVGFGGLIVGMLAIDLGVFNRNPHAISIRESILWTLVWVALSLAFNGFILVFEGHQPALEFLTGYVIEKSLSVDNIFVFALIFTYFGVPRKYQHKVLFWGIIGAAGMRLVLILLGTSLIRRFDWITYIFGAFLLYAAVRMALGVEERVEPDRNIFVRAARRLLPVSRTYHDDHFFVREGGRLLITPLVLVLIVVETTDVLFALDSIPAIFAVTTDPFIVFTSNLFAILGLRALYFALAGMLERFEYLKYGLAVVLALVGVKMLLAELVHVETWLMLVAVLALLSLSLFVSILIERREARRRREPADEDGGAAPPPDAGEAEAPARGWGA